MKKLYAIARAIKQGWQETHPNEQFLVVMGVIACGAAAIIIESGLY